MNTKNSRSPDDDAHKSTDDLNRPRLVTSEQLLQGRRELLIQHSDEIYRLRITSRGNLYLTK